jgi:hypothetical protein
LKLKTNEKLWNQDKYRNVNVRHVL